MMVFSLARKAARKVLGNESSAEALIKLNPLGTHSQDGHKIIQLDIYLQHNPRVSHVIAIGDKDTPGTIGLYVLGMLSPLTLKKLNSALTDGGAEKGKRIIPSRGETIFANEHVRHTISMTNRKFADFEMRLPVSL